MLTDEELAKMEAAVNAYDYGGVNPWTLAAEQCAEFTRDAIAREKAMRQLLTADICERLGIFKTEQKGVWYVSEHERSAFVGTYGHGLELKSAGPEVIRKPTVGHLFAAAKLAGVELDWRKVGG